MANQPQVAYLIDQLGADEMQDLADHLEVHLSTLYRWKDNPGKIGVPAFAKLAKWLERRNRTTYDLLKLLKPVNVTAERA